MPASAGGIAAIFLILLLATVAGAGDGTPTAAFYVATNGNDAWSGKLAAPNRKKTDGPFATVARAQTAVRDLRRGNPSTDATVLIRGGFYPLPIPLTFSAEDSGSPAGPIVYAAYPGETPVLSGGTRITGWKRVGGNHWEVTMPEVTQGKWYFGQLYVGGERRYRPRLPKQGYYFIAGDIPATPTNADKGFDRFRFNPGEIRADWHNREDVEALPFHVWTMSRFRIADVDDQAHVVTFTGPTIGKEAYTSLARGNRYLVENVREALTEPGEWYLDRKTGVLTYLAKRGEDPNRNEVVAPRLERLVEMDGTSNVTFRGLTFAHSAWNIPPEGNSFWQAEVNLPATIRVTNGQGVVFEKCTVRNTGNWAIELGHGAKRCRLDGCELIDLGAGGVKIGEPQNRPIDEVASHDIVTDCLIAHGGRIHPAAVGVWIGHSPYNIVTHNEIFDLYYTGISPGWSWGYAESGAHHNTIAYNHIHRIGQGVLSDMGGIYTLGVSPGTVLHHNLIHDVTSYAYGGWGIYFDEGSTGIIAENNVVYDMKSAPFHQHYGKENIVRNNIFAFGHEAELMRTRAEDHLSFTLSRNIVYWTDGPLLGSNWTGDQFALDHNLYWNAASKPVLFGKETLTEWQAKGFDKDSLVADPRFVNAVKRDFTLRPDSPALTLGFIPIDLSQTGRISARAYQGDVPPAFPPPTYPDDKPQPIIDSFEEATPGTKPFASGLTVAEEANVPAANIRVTDETAATGKHSLKFTDAAGQQHSYNPHLFYNPGFTSGTLVGAFSLRLEPGAVFYHEWRDTASPYRVGPSLRVDADGSLSAGGQRLTMLPRSQWVRFEITCGLGDTATGTYDLTVQLPGRVPPFRYKGLSCGSGKEFKELRWWGFVSDADGPALFYLDDLALAPYGTKP